jgi:salicylate hydroxylase
VSTRIAVIGGGIGGFTAALALRQAGVDVEVFEQAPEHRRVGAAITMTPNSVRVLEKLGLRDALRSVAYIPKRRLNRKWDTGEITATIELGDAAEKKFGAPTLQFLRADLVDVLRSALPRELLHFDRKFVSADDRGEHVDAVFSDGSRTRVDGIVGADGIHSTVRRMLFGPESPRFTGAVGYRAIVPASRLPQFDLTPFTKWYGPRPESEFLTSLTSSRGDFYIFASIHKPEWRDESWSMSGDAGELRTEFSDYAEEVHVMLEVCEEMLKTAIYERDPMPQWTRGRVTLLGDACHPMMPFMAQGAAMAIEDAAILGRCLQDVPGKGVPGAFLTYENARRARTATIQATSQQNQWPTPAVVDWVYGYDAWSVPLAADRTT